MKLNVNINLSWLKIVGSLVVFAGLIGFLYGLYSQRYVGESITVIGMGLGTLGYRKHLITKTNDTSNTKKDIQK